MSDCVVLKLVNGDQLMATLAHESSESIVIESPVMVRNIQVATETGTIEKTVTTPYCPITNETFYTFARSHVVFMKPLHPNVAELYKKLVKTFDHDIPEFADAPEDEEPRDESDTFLIMPDEIKIH